MLKRYERITAAAFKSDTPQKDRKRDEKENTEEAHKKASVPTSSSICNE